MYGWLEEKLQLNCTRFCQNLDLPWMLSSFDMLQSCTVFFNSTCKPAQEQLRNKDQARRMDWMWRNCKKKVREIFWCFDLDLKLWLLPWKTVRVLALFLLLLCVDPTSDVCCPYNPTPPPKSATKSWFSKPFMIIFVISILDGDKSI